VEFGSSLTQPCRPEPGPAALPPPLLLSLSKLRRICFGLSLGNLRRFQLGFHFIDADFSLISSGFGSKCPTLLSREGLLRPIRARFSYFSPSFRTIGSLFCDLGPFCQ
jgi:hypothetical protein